MIHSRRQASDGSMKVSYYCRQCQARRMQLIKLRKQGQLPAADILLPRNSRTRLEIIGAIR